MALLSHLLAIDLGTANTIFCKSPGYTFLMFVSVLWRRIWNRFCSDYSKIISIDYPSPMNKFMSILAITMMATVTLSCTCGTKTAKPAPQKQESSMLVPLEAAPESSVFDRLAITGEPMMLSDQKLTSEEAIEEAITVTFDNYCMESTPLSASFFFPEPDIHSDKLVRQVQLQYNYANVLNRIIHCYEWYCRQAEVVDEEGNELTRKDTLKLIKASQPPISESLLRRALPEEWAVRSAKKLLAAYKAFDGDTSEDSPFVTATGEYRKGYYDNITEIVDAEQMNAFNEGFWEWYDKAQFVPEIDDLVKIHLQDSNLPQPDSSQVAHLQRAAAGEKDIDRRSILALELTQFSSLEGVVLLGDIMESGIYTRYLNEVWTSWRAHLQLYHSPSSFSLIPNAYYDRLRVKCMNTILRHCQQEEDPQALCLLQDMILSEILHRMGSISGNESMVICMHLAYDLFIHPRMLEDEES